MQKRATPELLRSERESLERIHTFSLRDSEHSESSRDRSNDSHQSNKSFTRYLPEKVKIVSSKLRQAKLQVVEMCRLQTDFRLVGEMTTWKRQEYFRERLGKKKEMRISF